MQHSTRQASADASKLKDRINNTLWVRADKTYTVNTHDIRSLTDFSQLSSTIYTVLSLAGNADW